MSIPLTALCPCLQPEAPSMHSMLPSHHSRLCSLRRGSNHSGNYARTLAASLLVVVHVVFVLSRSSDPIFSQHMIAHHNPTATRHSFSEIIRSSPTSTTDGRVLSLWSQCLLPGEYHRHITRWLEHFPPKQVRWQGI